MANPIKVIKAAAKAATRAKTDAIQKNSVKVKPAAKTKPNKPNIAKVNERKASTGKRYSRRWQGDPRAEDKGYDHGVEKVFKKSKPVPKKRKPPKPPKPYDPWTAPF